MEELSPQDEEQKKKLEKVREKDDKYDIFSFTEEDHKIIHSTPPDELIGSNGKSYYEVISDKKIEELLDYTLVRAGDPHLAKNGIAEQQLTFFKKSIPFLKSVGRCPEKYKDMELN